MRHPAHVRCVAPTPPDKPLHLSNVIFEVFDMVVQAIVPMEFRCFSEVPHITNSSVEVSIRDNS